MVVLVMAAPPLVAVEHVGAEEGEEAGGSAVAGYTIVCHGTLAEDSL